MMTHEFPYGRDVSIAIVCYNDQHRLDVIEALQIKARYMLYSSGPIAARFEKIIVFSPKGNGSLAEANIWKTMLNEDYPTWLRPGGTLHII